MRGEGSKEREERAAEALLAAALRQAADDDKLAVELLPELSAAEKTALAALGADFMSRLLAGDPLPRKTAGRRQRPADAGQACGAAGESKRGLNRADAVDEAAAAEIERKRREITGRKRCDQDGGPADG